MTHTTAWPPTGHSAGSDAALVAAAGACLLDDVAESARVARAVAS